MVKKTKQIWRKQDFDVAWSDDRGGEAADEGDTAEAHPPEEGGTDRLHDEMLQKNPQLSEQGAGRGKTMCLMLHSDSLYQIISDVVSDV